MSISDPIFSAVNHHTPDCGEPPGWLREKAAGSRSYFENMHGEQWIAEASKDRLRLTGGEIGWDTYTIDDPDYNVLASQLSAGASLPWSAGKTLILNREENAWLYAVSLARARSSPVPSAGS